eukprot:922700-Amphidinium_carterae.2
MADAAQETIELLRAADGQVPVPELIHQVCDFRARIGFLFLEDGVWEINGFAAYASTQLKQQITWLVGNKACTLGGCSADLKRR